MDKYLWALHFMYVYGEKWSPSSWGLWSSRCLSSIHPEEHFSCWWIVFAHRGGVPFVVQHSAEGLGFPHMCGLRLDQHIALWQCCFLFSRTCVVYFLISTLHSCSAVCCFPHMWCHPLVVHKWHVSKYNNAHATNMNTHMHMQHVFVYVVWWVIDCTYVTTCTAQI